MSWEEFERQLNNAKAQEEYFKSKRRRIKVASGSCSPSSTTGCKVCDSGDRGFCCKYWSSPQDYWFKPPRPDELEHVELFGGKAIVKRKWGGLLYRVYWIVPIQCKNQAEDGKCNIYESRPQICKDYVCEKDEFIEIKRKLNDKNVMLK